jgi:hypothetical protein
MSNKRGGARQRAGRPPELTDLQRLAIGALVDRRLWEKTLAAWRRGLDAKFSELTDGELPRIHAQIGDTPPANRHKVDPEALDLALFDAEAVIETDLYGKRHFKGPTRVAAGIRGPLIRTVARAASRRWGKEITPRMVKRCLEDFRAMKARVDAQLACDGIAALLNWLAVTPTEV